MATEGNDRYIEDKHPDIIHSKVVAGIRPNLSSDDCPGGLKDLITQCWDSNPDVRLSFGGEHHRF